MVKLRVETQFNSEIYFFQCFLKKKKFNGFFFWYICFQKINNNYNILDFMIY